jgi:phospholipid/cholesterol/gamma-HCH transport system permease protein
VGRRRPDGLVLPAELEGVFGRLAELGDTRVEARAPYRLFDGTAQVGRMVFGFGRHLLQFVALVGQLCLDLVYLLRSGPLAAARDLGQLLQGRAGDARHRWWAS